VSCMKPLFAHVMTLLPACITKAKEVSLDMPQAAYEERRDPLMRLTRALLVVRGDMPAALNARKLMILNECLRTIRNNNGGGGAAARMLLREEVPGPESELRLLEALFTLHPKSPNAWHHRRWCLSLRHLLLLTDNTPDTTNADRDEWAQRIAALCSITTGDSATITTTTTTTTNVNVVQITEEQWKEERELCSLVNTRHPKNYYGWMHRLWLLTACVVLPAGGQGEGEVVVREEVTYSLDWLRKNVSDHCAVNYLVRALGCLESTTLGDSEALLRLYADALSPLRVLVQQHAGCHESLWYGMRAISSRMLKLLLVKEQSEGGGGVMNAYRAGELSLDGVVRDNQSHGEGSLASFLRSHTQLVRLCRQNIDVWDFQKQRVLATRYYAFLFNQAAASLQLQRVGVQVEVETLLKCADTAVASLKSEDVTVLWQELRSTEL
jgi:hypothetical protein